MQANPSISIPGLCSGQDLLGEDSREQHFLSLHPPHPELSSTCFFFKDDGGLLIATWSLLLGHNAATLSFQTPEICPQRVQVVQEVPIGDPQHVS